MIDATSTNTLIPSALLPASCRIHQCTFGFDGPGVTNRDGKVSFTAFPESTVMFTHTQPGKVAERFPILPEWLADINCDIWGDHVLPWLKGLHEEPA